jgi:succinate-semialdehyde dehydrogenase/glutarate-semialdehyde dehydrogenase
MTAISTYPSLSATCTQLSGLVTTAGDRPARSTYAPWDGNLVGEVPVCTADDVAFAVDTARRAQASWAELPIGRRCAVVRRFADLVLDHEAEILDLVQAETGKARMSAFEELGDAALTAGYYARTAPTHLRPRRRRGLVPVLTRAVEHHQPKGVVGIISPWNYPLTLAVSDAIPALLAGNAVVLKPDSQTPFTALLMVRLMREAGLPEALFQAVTGAGSELGPAIIARVDYLMFTGSTATGRIVAQQCAERLIGCSAELGGKNPLLVLDDADLDRAVEGTVQACFSNTGQLCISIERVYVADALHDAFVARLTDRVGAMRLGAGRGWDIDMGSLISAEQLATVTAHVDDAVAKGATVLAGGRPRPDLGPLFYEPTVLTGVTDEMRLARAETFGPVVAVYRVADDDEAVARANDTEYGLNASVWSRRRGESVARRLRAGTVNVNEGYAAAWGSHDAPMGGMGASGIGRRHGREGIHKYTEPQTIAEQRLIPVAPSPLLNGERYVRLMTQAVKLLRWLP